MTVDALRPQDSEDLLKISFAWGNPPLTVISPGAHGAVVRDDDGAVLAWALLRETSHGFCTDELWCARSRAGKEALALLAQWLERTVASIAFERGVPFLPLGGVVRNDNPAHDEALEKRGYEFVAKVRMKEIPAEHKTFHACHGSEPASVLGAEESATDLQGGTVVSAATPMLVNTVSPTAFSPSRSASAPSPGQSSQSTFGEERSSKPMPALSAPSPDRSTVITTRGTTEPTRSMSCGSVRAATGSSIEALA